MMKKGGTFPKGADNKATYWDMVTNQ
jgi:hypothetical protein